MCIHLKACILYIYLSISIYSIFLMLVKIEALCRKSKIINSTAKPATTYRKSKNNNIAKPATTLAATPTKPSLHFTVSFNSYTCYILTKINTKTKPQNMPNSIISTTQKCPVTIWVKNRNNFHIYQ